MGARVKYLVPILLLALTAVFFQNCGNKLHGNGDPYENPDIDAGPGRGDIPGGGTDGGGSTTGGGNQDNSGGKEPPMGGAVDFDPELSCMTKNAATVAFVTSVYYGKKDGADSVRVTIRGVSQKLYFPWVSTSSTLKINKAVGGGVTIKTITLNGNRTVVALNVTEKGQTYSVTELIDCK